MRLVEPAARLFPARIARDDAPPEAHDAEPSRRAIVVGYGPVGRTLARLLSEERVEPTIVDLDHETVTRLRAEGARAVYGDASQPAILVAAGVEAAGSLVFAASGSPDAVIRLARELNPKIRVLTRAGYLREIAMLKRVGAELVVSSEGEVALGMAEGLLRGLGATSEQIDHVRDRVRRELSIG